MLIVADVGGDISPPHNETPWIQNLTVCSFSVVLVAAVWTTHGVKDLDQAVEYINDVLSTDGTVTPPRKFLFHGNWLNRAYNYDPELWLSNPVRHFQWKLQLAAR